MKKLCALAQWTPREINDYHAASLAAFIWAMDTAHIEGVNYDPEAFHRTADLAFVLYLQEQAKKDGGPAELVEALELKAFIQSEQAKESNGQWIENVPMRFRKEVERLASAQR